MPYLTVDEQSTYIDVYCDGYISRVHTDYADSYIFSLRSTTGTSWTEHNLGSRNDVAVPSTYVNYYLAYDDTRATTIIENSSNRVVIAIDGNYATSSQTSMPGSSVQVYYTIYSDRFTFRLDWDVGTTFDQSSYTYPLALFFENTSAVSTDSINIYEDDGSESTDADSGSYTGTYIGVTSTVANFQMVEIDVKDPFDTTWSRGYSSSLDNIITGFKDSTLPVGTYSVDAIFFVDSGARVGGKQWTSADRLGFGKQYYAITDHENLITLEKGDPVTNLSIPSSLWTLQQGMITVNDYWTHATDLCQHVKNTDSVVAGVAIYLTTSSDSAGNYAYVSLWDDDEQSGATQFGSTSNTVYILGVNGATGGGLHYFTFPEPIHVVGDYFLHVYMSGTTVVRANTDETLYDSSYLLHRQGVAMSGDHVMGFQIFICEHGLASDGAYHVDANEFHEVKLRSNQIEQGTKLIVHDPSIRTGVNSEEHLLCHYKCDDNTSSSTLVASVGTNGSISSGNTSTYSVSGTRGLALDTQGSIQINLDKVTTHTNDFFQSGSLSFKFKPQFAEAVASDQYIVYVTEDGGFNDFFIFWYRNFNDTFYFRLQWNNVDNGTAGYGLQGPTFTTDIELQQWHTVTLFWDSDSGLNGFIFNGVPYTDFHTEDASTATSTLNHLSFGNSTSNGDFIVDDIKTYNAPILPYGTFIPSNIFNANNFYLANDDIVVYIHGDEADGDTLRIGGTADHNGTVTYTTGPDGEANSAFVFNGDGIGSDAITFDADDINTDTGKIGLWYYHVDTSESGYATLFSCGYATNSLRGRIVSATSIALYTPDGIFSNTFTVPSMTGQWNYLEFTWDRSASLISVTCNGVYQESTETQTSVSFTGETFYVGNLSDLNRDAGGYIYGFTISNKVDTPVLPFVMGKGPVEIPDIAGTRQQVVMQPDMNWLVTDIGDLQDGDSKYVAPYPPRIGEYVQDLNMPTTLGYAGKATDGAYHVDLDGTNASSTKPDFADGYSIDKDHTLAKDMIAGWVFNEGTGSSAYDVTGNGYTGTLTDGVTWVDDGVEAHASSNEHIDIGTFPNLSEVSVIFKTTVDIPNGWGRIFERGYTDGYGFGMAITADDLFWYDYVSHTTSMITTNADIAADGDTIVVCATSDRSGLSGMKIYVDGTVYTTTYADYLTSTGSDFEIFKRSGSDAYRYDGILEWMYIYDRVLTADEIAAITAEPFCMLHKPTVEVRVGRSTTEQAIVIHDPSIKTGLVGAPVDHLLCHLKFDKIVSTEKVINHVDGSEVGLDFDTATISSDGVRSNSLLTNSTSDRPYLLSSEVSNGSIFCCHFRYKSPSTITTRDYYPILCLASGDEIGVCHNSYGYSRITARSNYGTVRVHESVGTLPLVDEWNDVFLAIDSDSNFMYSSINGVMVPYSSGGPLVDWGTLSSIYIGYIDSGTDDILIDEMTFYDALVLPFGTYIPGNIVGYSQANSDITMYIQGDESDDDALKIGSGTITINGVSSAAGPDGGSNSGFEFTTDTDYVLIDNSFLTASGKLSFWYKTTGTISDSEMFIWDGNNFQLYKSGTAQALRCYIGGTQIFAENITADPWDGNWHFIELIYESGNTEVTIDGVVDVVSTTTFSAPTTNGDIHIGGEATRRNCEGIIYGMTFVDNLNTPQFPFVLGAGPVHAPVIDVGCSFVDVVVIGQDEALSSATNVAGFWHAFQFTTIRPTDCASQLIFQLGSDSDLDTGATCGYAIYGDGGAYPDGSDILFSGTATVNVTGDAQTLVVPIGFQTIPSGDLWIATTFTSTGNVHLEFQTTGGNDGRYITTETDPSDPPTDWSSSTSMSGAQANVEIRH